LWLDVPILREQIFLRLFAKYIRLPEIVELLMLRHGFRSTAVLATFTFTTATWGGCQPKRFGILTKMYARPFTSCVGAQVSKVLIWCLVVRQFGWNPKLQEYNTNLHCHGLG
jgi:hypothetical protein